MPIKLPFDLDPAKLVTDALKLGIPISVSYTHLRAHETG